MKRCYLQPVGLALFASLFVSCVGSKDTTLTTTFPDGSVTVQDNRSYAQLGGNTNYARLPDGTVMFNADMTQSFGHAMAAAAAAVGMVSWANVSKAATAAQELTKQKTAQSAASAQTARVQAASTSMQVLGSNPEANVGAINAVGNVIRP